MQLVAELKGTIRRHPGRWAIAGVLVAGAMVFGLYWFAPWNLFVDRRVNEALPTVGGVDSEEGAAVTGAAGETGTEPGGATGAEGEAAGSIELARGDFVDLEHATFGAAVVIELEVGTRFLRLEDLETTNGPDLRVVLTDQPLSADSGVWDDGEVVDLGALKGNVGSSNYEIPDGLDLSGFQTVVIWCRRFSVGFGVAPLEAA